MFARPFMATGHARSWWGWATSEPLMKHKRHPLYECEFDLTLKGGVCRRAGGFETVIYRTSGRVEIVKRTLAEKRDRARR